MSGKYKMIAVDMDGTLLQSDKTIHADSVRDIQAATDMGIQVVYCSGRALAELRPYFTVLPMVRYAVCYSGAIVYDCIDRKCIYRSEIEQADVDKIVRTARKYQAMAHFLTEAESIVSSDDITHMDDFHMGVYQKLYLDVAKQVHDMEEEGKLHASIPKINIYFRSDEGRKKGYEELKHLPLTFAFAERTSLEMTKAGVSKATGLMQLASFLGLSLEQTVGIGDADNDREMLSNVGFPVAMANADDKIKALCKFVTKDNDHNGVGAAIRYLMEQTI